MAAVLRAGLDGPPPSLPTHHWRTLRALLACRTPALGGHRYRCQECGQTHFVPHSCRNRHCPLCQGQAAHQWLEQQQEALLPVPYFHVVFTLPHVLNPLIRQNQRALYTLLFQAASQTLLRFGQSRLGAQLGEPGFQARDIAAQHAHAGRMLQLAAGLLEAELKQLLAQVAALDRQFRRR